MCESAEVFRLKLGNDPPVDAPPMKIEFTGEQRSVKVRQRTYSPAQLKFLKKTCNELVDLGFIYRNPTSNWACAPVIVPKPGPEEFRFTTDLNRVNIQTKKNMWSMPHADAMLPRTSGAKLFFLLDFLHGYWQFAMSKCSQECLAFHTPFGVFSPTRVPHGATNSVAYFQSNMELMFAHLGVLIRLDDILGYGRFPSGLLDNLRNVLHICTMKRLKLNPNKCELVVKEAQLCGRIIDAKSTKFNPRNYSALVNMPAPKTVGSLMELVHGANWMRTAIPNFSELISPLQELLEEQYKLYNMRKKSKIYKRSISARGGTEIQFFSFLIGAMVDQVKLATPDSSKRLCLFTGASSTHWSGLLTQVALSDVDSNAVSPQDWEHEPISFVSGTFKGSSLSWSKPEQECYAVVASIIRLSHILAACEQFLLFTDHKNTLYMLPPNRFDTRVARHTVHKTQRRALQLAEFDFTIEHIPGESNTWANILTRWANPDHDACSARRLATLAVPSITEDVPELPSAEVISESQKKDLPPLSAEFTINKGGTIEAWRNNSEKLYTPTKDTELQLRICVAALGRMGGHRGCTATKAIIQEKVYWSTMNADVDAFCQDCFVCIVSASGQKIPRPMDHQQHAERVSELLHFDFLYVGESVSSYEYILILKDDFSGYGFLRPC